ncbi:hypothetical protein BpHYR1_045141 [Brachionus plicatilis]|uniref:Uncharacterized protein n=1 Tax=Brachionus plicatilis TaxID=10195 RepID=A0A3M7QPI7_BRAPC|nr:hypothetical protein BpHYR1_045141 [Brachionus plicatilis]
MEKIIFLFLKNLNFSFLLKLTKNIHRNKRTLSKHSILFYSQKTFLISVIKITYIAHSIVTRMKN